MYRAAKSALVQSFRPPPSLVKSEFNEIITNLLRTYKTDEPHFVNHIFCPSICPPPKSSVMSHSNIDKDVIWRLLASARGQYLADNMPGAPSSHSSPGMESEPNFLLEFLADHLMPEDDEWIEEKVAFERKQFPDLRILDE
jgi:hypothetical protein